MPRKLATLLALMLCSCTLKDDPAKIQIAYNHCKSVAELNIHRTYPNASISFGSVKNTSSDPTTNSFEFIFSNGDISSDPAIPELWVMCRGNAHDKAITELTISGNLIEDLPLKY